MPYCRSEGWQRLLSARIICKYVDGISQNLQSVSPFLPTVFSLLGIMVKQVKSSSQKQVDISEPTIFNQSISMNRCHTIEALIFIREFSVFP